VEERDDGVPPLGDTSSDQLDRSGGGRGSGVDADAGRSAPGAGAPDGPSGPPTARPTDTGSDGVRIAAVEAAVAAGLAPSTGRRPDQAPAGDDRGRPATDSELFSPLELPDWGDPPTGQVPRILLDDEEFDAGAGGSTMRGPSWRENRSDWDEDLDLAFLVEDDVPAVAAHAGRDDASPLDADGFDIDDDAWASLLDGAPPPADADHDEPLRPRRGRGAKGAARASHRRAGDDRAPSAPARPAHAAGRPRRQVGRGRDAAPVRPRARRSPLQATVTGIVAGAIALACFLAGPVASLALVAVLVTLAAGEAFGAIRRSGREPATLLGLLAVPALVVGSYFRGPQAVPLVLGLVVLLTFCWYLLDGTTERGAHEPVANLGATLLVVSWVGVLGSFAGLLLDPAAYPHRHGVAVLVGAVAITIAADVGAYATGSLVGRHPLARRISPNKSWEGLAGGTVLALVVAATVVARIHPFTLPHALLLGVVVAVVAPIGDLAESIVKRDLGVKDMGSLLPAHGGVLDRVDAMLFVLPAAYYLVRIVHIA